MICVDLERKGEGTIEIARESLATVQTRLAVLNSFAAGDTNRFADHLNLQIGLADAGDLGDSDDVIALSKDVDRRVAATGAGTSAEPPARTERIERLLELKVSIR